MSLFKSSDEKLVSQAVHGDEQSMSRLYDRYAQAIFRYCFYQLGDEAIAQDLMQDTFVEVIHSLRTFNFTGSFKSWIYTIAKRLVFAQLREKYRLPKTILHDWLPAPQDPDWIDEKFQAQKKEKAVKKLLSRLKPKERQVIELTYLQQLTSKEAGAVTGRTPESVRVIVHRAIKKLSFLKKYD